MQKEKKVIHSWHCSQHTRPLRAVSHLNCCISNFWACNVQLHTLTAPNYTWFRISMAHLPCDVRMLSIVVSRTGQSPRFSSLPAGRTKTVTWQVTWPAGRPAYCSYNVSARHYRQRSLVFEFLRDWKRYESIHVERGPTVSRVVW